MRKYEGDFLSLISNDRPCRVRFHSLSVSFQAHVANAMSCLRRHIGKGHSHSVIGKTEVFFDVYRKYC